MILLLGYGPDTPPRKLFLQRRYVEVGDNPSNDRYQPEEEVGRPELPYVFSWRPVIHFLFWTSLWSVYVLVLCGVSVKQYGGLSELFKRYMLNIMYRCFALSYCSIFAASSQVQSSICNLFFCVFNDAQNRLYRDRKSVV